jgi:menaquinone-dependent protoporphyrinogen oxidase
VSILVTYASKYGATRGIAERITRQLQRLGAEAYLQPIDAATSPAEFRAMVIGSAIYYGSWLQEATEFVRRNRAVLAARPIWLFSSGPLGVEVQDVEQQPKELTELQETIKPRDHRIFFGALDAGKLSFGERMAIKSIRAPEGDYRDWDAIEMWAGRIVLALAADGWTFQTGK